MTPSPVFAWLNLKAEVDEVMLTFADQGLLLSSAVNIQRKKPKRLGSSDPRYHEGGLSYVGETLDQSLLHDVSLSIENYNR